MKENDCIGVYDSGIGGMTLLAECARLLPNENFCYYGDNKNAPYGNRTKEEIYALAERVTDHFASLPVKAVVIACNTVTTECIADLRQKYSFPFVGTEPAVRLAVNCKKPLVLATAATLRSPAFLRLQRDREAKGQRLEVFAPSALVGEIERNAPDLEKIGIFDHLPPLDCDGVVLGCTHYIYLKERIAKYYNAPCYDGNAGTAKRLRYILEKEGILSVSVERRRKISFAGECGAHNETLFKRMFSECFILKK
jgi:glutamate racemase